MPAGADEDAEDTASPTPEPEEARPSRRARYTAAVKGWWAEKGTGLLVAGGSTTFLGLLLVLSLKGLYSSSGEPPFLSNGPRVNLGYTTYVGTRLPNDINEFLGMRYASPPTGPLRWRAPVEPRNDNDSVHYANKGVNIPPYSQSEDCLYVNIWAPSTASNTSKLPVWVYIQGGGYTGNANANWNGAEVVRRSGHNILLVNFNYRVGMWGFLASKRVTLDGELNVGLLDQRELLRWVRRHIAQFGGDPNHVVIAGGSAGAGSVAMHQIAYGGRDDGLFHGAIAESVFFPAQPFVHELEWQFDRVLASTGCSSVNDADAMSCLRTLDTDDLERANTPSAFPGKPANPLPLFYWTPCVDGDLIRDLPYRMFRNGSFIRVPMLYGTTTDEGSVFTPDMRTAGDVETFLIANFPFLGRADMRAVMEHYPPMKPVPQHAAWFPTGSLAYGETTFTCPAVNIFGAVAGRWGALASSRSALDPFTSHHETEPLQNQHQALSAEANPDPAVQPPTTPPIWLYRYNVHDKDNEAAGIGVPHLCESAAVFGPDNINNPPASYYSYNAPIIPIVMDYWISFVRTLDPNVFRNMKAPVWRPWGAVNVGGGNGSVEVDGGAYDKEEGGPGPTAGMRLVFETGNLTMERLSPAQMERCRFWLDMGETMRQ